MGKLAALLVGTAFACPAGAGSYSPDESTLPLYNDFATGKLVVARIVAVAARDITVQSLTTGYEKKLYGRMGADMIGRCVSVVQKSEKSFDVNFVECTQSKDTASRLELKRRMDDAAKGN